MPDKLPAKHTKRCQPDDRRDGLVAELFRAFRGHNLELGLHPDSEVETADYTDGTD